MNAFFVNIDKIKKLIINSGSRHSVLLSEVSKLENQTTNYKKKKKKMENPVKLSPTESKTAHKII